MPVVNNAVVFASGTLAQYTAATKSADTIYFITDTNQIFVGSDEYTKSYVTLSAEPTTSTPGKIGTLGGYNGNLYACTAASSGSYTWVRVANVNDMAGSVTSVAASDGVETADGNPITTTGTIKHSIPSGAVAHTDAGAAQTATFGGTFNVETVGTDKFGHVNSITTSTVTMPTETAVTATQEAGTATTITDGGTFSAVTAVAKGTGSHEVEVTTTQFTIPTGMTYTLSTGDTEGTVKVTPSVGSAYDVTVKDWDKLAKLTDITTVFRYKGTVASVSDLPASNNKIGDVYFVTTDNSEYVWAGTSDASGSWEKLGPVIDLSGYVPTSRTVNGHALTGDVTLDKTDVGLGNVDNTADANKNVATAAALTTARTIALSGGATGTATSFDGTANITIPVTALDASVLTGTAAVDTTGNAATADLADEATALETSRQFSITGGATAVAVDFNGTDDVALNVTSLDATKLTGTASIDTTGNAATATSATNATNATNDGSGNNIVSTYATKDELATALKWNAIV